MERQIIFTLECKKALQSLHIDIQRSMKSLIKKLSRGKISGKQLSEQLKEFFSLRDGNYRAIYRILDNKIIVFDVGHRSNVYSKVLANKMIR